MSEHNLEIARRMVAALESGAPELALEYLHPEVEYDVRVRPDGKVWKGHEGARRAFAEWTDAWTDWHMQVETFLDLGGDRVAFLWHEHGRAKASGVPMSLDGITVLTLSEGLVVSILASVDREGTLAELGGRTRRK